MAPQTSDGISDAPFLPEEMESASWNLTDVDLMLLKQTDEDYEPHDWEELKAIIGTSTI
jgi:hypothetical protein